MKSRKNVIPTVLSLALTAALFVGCILFLGRLRSETDRSELESVRSRVEKGITLCYSIEGAYPESLDYLVENYGVSYDSEKYIVHFLPAADNIRPTVSVIERKPE